MGKGQQKFSVCVFSEKLFLCETNQAKMGEKRMARTQGGLPKPHTGENYQMEFHTAYGGSGFCSDNA